MSKKRLTSEERIIDLLEKSLIVQLYTNGATRDEIKKILLIGSEKISPIIASINKKGRNKNESKNS